MPNKGAESGEMPECRRSHDKPNWGVLSGVRSTAMAVFDNGNEQATSWTDAAYSNSVLSATSCP